MDLKNELDLIKLYDQTPKEIINRNIDLICGPKSEFAPINTDLRSLFMVSISTAESSNTVNHWWRSYGKSHITRTRVPLDAIKKIAALIGESPETFMRDDDGWYKKRKKNIDKIFATYMADNVPIFKERPDTFSEKLLMALNHAGYDSKSGQKYIDDNGLGPKTMIHAALIYGKTGAIKAKTIVNLVSIFGIKYKERFIAHDGTEMENFYPTDGKFVDNALNMMAEHNLMDKNDVDNRIIHSVKEVSPKAYNQLRKDHSGLKEKIVAANAAGGKFEYFFLFDDGYIY